jgi:hypothetical protein
MVNTELERKNDKEPKYLNIVLMCVEQRMPVMMMASSDYYDCAMSGETLTVRITDKQLRKILKKFKRLVLQLRFHDEYEGDYTVKDITYVNGRMEVVLSFA